MDHHRSLGTIYVFIIISIISMNNMLCTTSCPTFYNTTCPNALKTIRTTIRTAVSRERRMAALLIRLHFHDCFVQGCDASILLNDTTPNERGTLSNSGVGGYEVIDAAKAAVERICPGVVSCADILAVAARDASVAVGGPSWKLRLGRRDSTTTNPTEADRDLPRGDQDLDSLIRNFANKGLNEREMVALSGSHTIGQARCVTFRGRIYSNTTNLDPGFGSTRRRNCPPAAPEGNTNLAPLDLVTPNSFDNNYFRNLLRRRGLLISDQVLFNGGSSDNIVLEYVNNPSRFRSDFAAAMIKMGNIELLTGNNGVIRTVCGASN
ncbi:basic peroxidase-like [Cynara cardunculus var. scolymus]|uniref:basic peroxidase-like n=1 Tax=Cynara cardunculus var. scolymus TaxID=59895 RepID=UPI000D628CDC|nr:basic peroxidase-like [Cynara cardunculus var. scolymus]